MQPALCGNTCVMHTEIPLAYWGTAGSHIPETFCKECGAIYKKAKKGEKQCRSQQTNFIVLR
jgi:hypothetical protein